MDMNNFSIRSSRKTIRINYKIIEILCIHPKEYTHTCDAYKFFKLFEKNDESFKVQIHENESREE